MTIEMVLAGMGSLLMLIAGYGVSCLKDLTRSVQELNIKMAVVISQQKNQADEINDQGKRISKLEEKA